MSETQSKGSTIPSQTREARSLSAVTNEQSTIPRERIGPSAIGQVLILLSFLLLSFFTYSNTFHSPFHFDDHANIEDNPRIRVTELSWQEITDVFKSRFSARPVPMLSFAFNYYFGRYDVAGYHLVNTLIHGINAILLCLFFRTTLGLLQNPPPHASRVAFFAALLWLVHPVQTQSVTYIVQRINSVASLFYILSFVLYVRGRIVQRQRAGTLQYQRGTTRQATTFLCRLLWFTGSGLAGLLAMGSKEVSVTLPFFIFLYEWYFFQDLSWPWLRRWLPWMLGACIPVLVLLLVHFGFDPLVEFSERYAVWPFTLSQRVMTEFRVVLYYVSLLFYPHPSRLNLDYDFPLSYSLFHPPTTLLSLCVIAGMMALAFWLAKSERLLSFCILWFFGNLVIESSVIPLDLVFEHRLYLPSMLLSLLVVEGVYRHIRPKELATGLLCLAAVVMSVWTYQRNEVWRDEGSLWSDTVKKSTNKARPHNNLGEAFVKEDRLDQAMVHFRKALEIEPDNATVHNNLGELLCREGRLEEGVSHFRQALRIRPGFATAHRNLGNVFQKYGKTEEAVVEYRKALRIKPYYAKVRASVHNNLGLALANQDKLEEAIIHFHDALRIEPDYETAHNNLGNVLLRQGKTEEAIAHFRDALRIRADFADAHFNLGNALFQQQDLEAAITHYQEALRIRPNFADAHFNLGLALRKQGNPEEAQKHYQEAVRIRSSPMNPQVAPLQAGKQE